MILVRSRFQSMQLNNTYVLNKLSKVSENDGINVRDVICRGSIFLASWLDSQRLDVRKSFYSFLHIRMRINADKKQCQSFS